MTESKASGQAPKKTGWMLQPGDGKCEIIVRHTALPKKPQHLIGRQKLPNCSHPASMFRRCCDAGKPLLPNFGKVACCL